VELLVVVSILAALTGLGFQHYSTIKDRADAEAAQATANLINRTLTAWQTAGGLISGPGGSAPSYDAIIAALQGATSFPGHTISQPQIGGLSANILLGPFSLPPGYFGYFDPTKDLVVVTTDQSLAKNYDLWSGYTAATGTNPSNALISGMLNNLIFATDEALASFGGWNALSAAQQSEAAATLRNMATGSVVGNASAAGAAAGLVNLLGQNDSLNTRDFSGMDLSKADLSRLASGDNSNFSNAIIGVIGGSFRNSNFSGANFSGASGSNATFTDANFSGAITSGANITYSDFGSSLSRAQVEGLATLRGNIFRFVEWDGINLTNKDLRDTQILGGVMRNALFVNTNLANTALHASIGGVNFSGATSPSSAPVSIGVDKNEQRVFSTLDRLTLIRTIDAIWRNGNRPASLGGRAGRMQWDDLGGSLFALPAFGPDGNPFWPDGLAITDTLTGRTYRRAGSHLFFTIPERSKPGTPPFEDRIERIFL
jgi:uncharacterized protein YjbI with pentapeptide repeats/type II secretory pathway pseudopilin PulG